MYTLKEFTNFLVDFKLTITPADFGVAFHTGYDFLHADRYMGAHGQADAFSRNHLKPHE
jgi:hypothetical protein